MKRLSAKAPYLIYLKEINMDKAKEKICPHCGKKYQDFQLHLPISDIDLSLGEPGLCPSCLVEWNREIEKHL